MERELSSIHRLVRVTPLAGVLALCLWTLSIACIPDDSHDYPAFGFQAGFDLPQKRPHDECGFDNGGPTSRRWMEGPHAGFDKLDPSRLALESLEWFEHSTQAVEWRGNSTARIALIYPSNSRKVSACFAPELDLTWEDQLRSWFERYPPSAGAHSDLADEGYHWSVEFGDRGGIRGDADTASLAVESMRSVLGNPVSPLIFDEPSFSLGFTTRRSSRAMDCYFVEADSPEQIDELPRRLREKRAQNGGS